MVWSPGSLAAPQLSRLPLTYTLWTAPPPRTTVRQQDTPTELDRGAWLEAPIDAAALNSLVDRAEALATVMGFSQPHVDGGGEGSWYVLDTAHASFGELVPQAAMEVATTGRRGTAGMVQIDDEWVAMERPPEDQLA